MPALDRPSEHPLGYIPMPILALGRSNDCGSNWCPSIAMAHTRVPPQITATSCIPHPHTHDSGVTPQPQPARGPRFVLSHSSPSHLTILTFHRVSLSTRISHTPLPSLSAVICSLPSPDSEPRKRIPTSLIFLAPPFFTLWRTRLRSFCILDYYPSVEALQSLLKSSSAGLATTANRQSSSIS